MQNSTYLLLCFNFFLRGNFFSVIYFLFVACSVWNVRPVTTILHYSYWSHCSLMKIWCCDVHAFDTVFQLIWLNPTCMNNYIATKWRFSIAIDNLCCSICRFSGLLRPKIIQSVHVSVINKCNLDYSQNTGQWMKQCTAHGPLVFFSLSCYSRTSERRTPTSWDPRSRQSSRTAACRLSVSSSASTHWLCSAGPLSGRSSVGWAGSWQRGGGTRMEVNVNTSLVLAGFSIVALPLKAIYTFGECL